MLAILGIVLMIAFYQSEIKTKYQNKNKKFSLYKESYSFKVEIERSLVHERKTRRWATAYI